MRQGGGGWLGHDLNELRMQKAPPPPVACARADCNHIIYNWEKCIEMALHHVLMCLQLARAARVAYGHLKTVS